MEGGLPWRSSLADLNSVKPGTLLALCLAIRHFQHWLEGRHFTILTGHKPIVQAVQRGAGNNPTDVRHIKKAENAVADALFWATVHSSSVVLD
ncbi:hypothetical protein T07_10224 [Trichinella nelsoni]|uniref:Reverse transcriptase RNase H-like domain-containing protein n=1 Tax=Trichinella nelsoni TaxID=6336 RepID=A0A0V0S045_9BILA|nr:hypothetical protein T07_10224 [Trichinella nelsoni]